MRMRIEGLDWIGRESREKRGGDAGVAGREGGKRGRKQGRIK